MVALRAELRVRKTRARAFGTESGLKLTESRHLQALKQFEKISESKLKVQAMCSRVASIASSLC